MIYRVEVLCEKLDRKKKLIQKKRYFLVEATSGREALHTGNKVAEELAPFGEPWRAFTCLSAFPMTFPVECGPI